MEGKPNIIIAKTIIGKGIEAIEGTNAAHGEAGVKHTDESRKSLGLPEDKWYVSPDTRTYLKNKVISTKVRALSYHSLHHSNLLS
jgi:transketolase